MVVVCSAEHRGLIEGAEARYFASIYLFGLYFLAHAFSLSGEI